MKRLITILVLTLFAGVAMGQGYFPKGTVTGKKNAAAITAGSGIAVVDSVLAKSGTIKFYNGATQLIPDIPPAGYIDGLTVYSAKYLTDTIFDATAVDTLALLDAGRVMRYNYATRQKVYVPTNTAVAFPIGTVINIKRDGAGIVGILPASGVVVQSELDSCYINNKHGWATLVKRATNKWDLFGSLTN